MCSGTCSCHSPRNNLIMKEYGELSDNPKGTFLHTSSLQSLFKVGMMISFGQGNRTLKINKSTEHIWNFEAFYEKCFFVCFFLYATVFSLLMRVSTPKNEGYESNLRTYTFKILQRRLMLTMPHFIHHLLVPNKPRY